MLMKYWHNLLGNKDIDLNDDENTIKGDLINLVLQIPECKNTPTSFTAMTRKKLQLKQYKYAIEISPDALRNLQLKHESEQMALFDILNFYFYLEVPKYLEAALNENNHKDVSENEKASPKTQIASSDPKDISVPLISNDTLRIPSDLCDLRIFSVDFDEDATKIFAAFGEREFGIFQKIDDKYVLKTHTCDKDGSVYSVKCIPGTSLLLVASDQEVSVLNTTSMQYEEVSFEHVHCSSILTMDIDSTNTWLATGGESGTVCVFDLRQNLLVRVLACSVEHINVVRIHPNGRYLAAGSHDTSITLWDIDSSLCVRYFFHGTAVYACAFSPNGKLLASADDRGCICIWDLKVGFKFSEFHFYGELCKENFARVTSMCFDPSSSILAVSNMKGNVKMWNFSPPEKTLSDEKFEDIPLLIRFDKNGQLKVVLQEKENEETVSSTENAEKPKENDQKFGLFLWTCSAN